MSNNEKALKIIAVVGSTASGKTKLGVRLAARFSGEIVSADSRQVYRGMDIGTGKDLAEYTLEISNSKFQISNKFNPAKLCGTKFKILVPHHLIDIVDPNEEFNLAEYQRLAYRAIDDILKRGKLPIIVGGSGLYLQAVIDGYTLPDVKPDLTQRREREKKSVPELFTELMHFNSKFAEKLNKSDKNNKRRLIRYLEIESGRKTIKSLKEKKVSEPKYDALVIGVSRPLEELEKRIYDRLNERLEKEDMVGEVERLNNNGVSWRRLESFGLEYKYIAMHLQGKMEYEEMADELYRAIRKFSKRQLTWFRRWERQGREIKWVNNETEAFRLVEVFIGKKGN